MASSLGRDLPGHLLDLDHHKFVRLERGVSDNDIHNALVNIALGGRLTIASDYVCLAGCLALEGALAEQVLHKSADVEANLGPERLIIWLEHHPLRAAIQALFDKQGRPTNRDVLPLRGESI